MAISGGDGSIILTTKIDQNGLKSGLKGMTSLVTKSFAVIGAAAATATVAITKMATDAYADYEQLVGGVETLFKGSAGKVLEYANQAFATTGQSANEYMRNVTAFSASLLSAVGGDTEKAAEVANAAMISISDNVNKMGSSAESVQLAFQGFAKQQYMLLDNLKLGYGGTKTEMERLLRDAQAITGVKYDISNLADVYTAIGVIQEKLGIAGTTAREAESTISGSAAMMKAAWENVLAAVAGGGDLDVAINNLVYSIQRYFENIVPVVERSLVGIGRLIEKIAPMLVRNVASALIQAIPSLINAVYQMIVGLAKGIWQGIKALFTGGSGSVTAEIKTSISGVADSAGEASTGMEALGDATEEAGKQAKKSLAAFDDLNILSSGAKSAAEEIPAMAMGETGIDVSNGLSVVLEDKWQLSFLDEILNTLEPIQEIFMSGFWRGFQSANFMPVARNLEEIKESLISISKNSDISSAFSKISESFLTLSGTIAGAGFSIGSNIASNVVLALEQYLSTNAPFITNSISRMFEASPEIFTAISDLVNAFAGIFSVFSSENGVAVSAALIEILANSRLNMTEMALTIGSDVVSNISKGISDNQEGLKTTLDGILGIFASLFTDISTLITESFTNISDLYDEHIKPLIDTIGETLSELIGKVTETFQTYIMPVLEEFASKFSDLVNGEVSPTIQKILDFVGQVADAIGLLLKNVIKPLILYLVEKLGPVFADVFSIIGDKFLILLELSTNTVSSIIDIFGGLIDFFTGVFTGDLELAFSGIKRTFTGLFDGIAAIFKATLNVFIEGINGLASGINGAIGVINDIPGISIPKLKKIPKLAQGTVVPPNREFMAILGDNTKEHEIVSPVSTMKQAFTEAMAEMGAMGQTTKEEHYYLSETELMSVIYKLVKGGERLKGNSLISGGAY